VGKREGAKGIDMAVMMPPSDGHRRKKVASNIPILEVDDED
jgi:hypothetical protein